MSMSKIPGTAILLIGRSGVGKTSLVEGVLKDVPNLFQPVPGTTTRSPRSGEEKLHHFVDRETFTRWKNEGAFAAHFTFQGNEYGTRREDWERALLKGPVIATSSPLLIEQLKQYIETIFIIKIQPEGDWTPRAGREEGDEVQGIETCAVDYTVKNHFPKGFEMALGEVKAFIVNVLHTKPLLSE